MGEFDCSLEGVERLLPERWCFAALAAKRQGLQQSFALLAAQRWPQAAVEEEMPLEHTSDRMSPARHRTTNLRRRTARLRPSTSPRPSQSTAHRPRTARRLLRLNLRRTASQS